jgi:alkanesulfonate monooxygenase SsuD/methylene tetrahydromethanopterin reductase-like flavin-dependent oxidoreductase (luciferase family)
MTAPLGSGSVSLRLYPATLPPAGVVADLQAQARLAEEAGFDGCMTSEHHGGFPNYLPNALLVATWLLEATDRLWAAPCPMVLPLRAASQVVEDLAWTHHRFPGRLGVGFAAGALPVDFELAGVPFSEMFPRYRTALTTVTAALSGRAEGALAGDPGVAALTGGEIPMVAAVQAVATAERAARLGLGLLFDSLQTVERTRLLSDAYLAAGGRGPRILIRRVWVGPAPAEQAAVQMDRYRGYAPARAMAHWGDDELIAGDDGAEVASRLAETLTGAGCDALNIRVFLAGMTPAEVQAQMIRQGQELLPPLRSELNGNLT